MRTTLDIDEDVLRAVKELARHEGITAGATVSRLVRQALTRAATSAAGVQEPAVFYGFRPFARRGGVVTNDEIDALRDREGS